MIVSIMSADDLTRYAQPQTDLERALLDALTEALQSIDYQLDELDEAKTTFDALADRYDTLEEERDILIDALADERTRNVCS